MESQMQALVAAARTELEENIDFWSATRVAIWMGDHYMVGYSNLAQMLMEVAAKPRDTSLKW